MAYVTKNLKNKEGKAIEQAQPVQLQPRAKSAQALAKAALVLAKPVPVLVQPQAPAKPLQVQTKAPVKAPTPQAKPTQVQAPAQFQPLQISFEPTGPSLADAIFSSHSQNFAYHSLPSAQINRFMDINPNAGKPIILSTPLHKPLKPEIETFPNHSKILQQLAKPVGLPANQEVFKLPGFDIYEPTLDDLILYLKAAQGHSAQDREGFQERLKESIKATYGENFTDEELTKAAILKEQKLLKYAKGDKVFGNSQETGTEGHAEAIDHIKEHYKKDDDVILVSADLSVKRILGVQLGKNIRPDVIAVKKDGSVTLVEVVSGSQNEKDMKKKLELAGKEIKDKYPVYKGKEIEYIAVMPENTYKTFK